MDQPGDSPPPGVEPSLLEELESHATKLAREAGALLLDYFQKDLQVEYKSKGHQDPVTEADRRAEALLIDGIAARFPHHGILSEERPETIRADADFLWVLDPLDGTTNFLNRYPCFGVSVGVLHQGVPVAGALFVPSPVAAGGEVLHARLNGGAHLDDTAIHVFDEEEPTRAGLVSMPAYFWGQFRIGRDMAQRLGEVRTTGSIAYEMALVATGVLQYAAFGAPKIWDVAAGVLIVKEAGGEALLRKSKPGRWEPLRSFLEPDSGLPQDGNLRKWATDLLIGNASVAGFVADNLRPRSKRFRWMRHLRYRLGARSGAKEQHGEGPEQGTPDSPEGPPPGGEGPPPPQASAER